MDTFWLKMAGAAVVVVVGVVLIGMFTSGGPQEPEKTFYDQAQQDRERFLAEPKPLDSEQKETASPQEAPAQESPAAPEPAQPMAEPPRPAGPVTLYFKELSEMDGIEAERLLNVAVPARSIGRLPMTGFKLMVDNCRQIIQRWPDSSYAYKAKRMLAEMPERYQQQYSITQQELDVGRFSEPRPGTKPFTVEELR